MWVFFLIIAVATSVVICNISNQLYLIKNLTSKLLCFSKFLPKSKTVQVVNRKIQKTHFFSTIFSCRFFTSTAALLQEARTVRLLFLKPFRTLSSKKLGVLSKCSNTVLFVHIPVRLYGESHNRGSLLKIHQNKTHAATQKYYVSHYFFFNSSKHIFCL